MKKYITMVLLLLVFTVAGCGAHKTNYAQSDELTIKAEDAFVAYSQNADGTWECGGLTYKYRLEITGRLSNAVADTTYVYLSNIKDISFTQAWKAAGLSSNSEDYFDVKDAVLVEMRVVE